MNVVEAKAELTKILRPFRALEELEDVLAVAAKLDSERIGVTRALAQAKQDLDNTKAAKEVADRDYTDRQAKIEAGMKALRAQYQAQEASYSEQAAVLRDQIAAAQRERDETRKAAEAAAKAAIVEAAKRTADLAQEYAARKTVLNLELEKVQQQLTAAKAELSALLKRVTG